MRPLDMSRDTVRAIVFLFLFALILGAANLIFTAHEIDAIRSNVATSQRAEASVVQLCETGNEARAEQLGLWEYILGLSKHPQTAEQKQIAVRFDAHIHQVFRPRDCQAITH